MENSKINIYEEICTRFVIEPRACYCRANWRSAVRWVVVKDLVTGKYIKDPENKRRQLGFKNSVEAIEYLKKYIQTK